MRAADPSIKLLSSFPSDRLMEVAGGDLDYLCPHQYDVANLDGTANELNDVRRMIREHGNGRPYRVAVTEWNTTAGDMGLGRAKLWTLRNALDCSRYHNLLHRNADMVEIANRSNLTNSFCSGIIQTNRSGMYLTPTYYAQRLYSNYAGTRPLRIEGETSLDYSATLSEDGKWLTLFVVNEEQVPKVRKLDLSAFGAPDSAEVWTLTDRRHAGQPDVSNSFEEPDRVSPVHGKCSLTDGVTFEPLSLTVLRIRANG
jgi:alpha-L-arabinofuranosidase